MKKLLAALLISIALISCSKNESPTTLSTASTPATAEASAPEASTPSQSDNDTPVAGPITTGAIKEGVDYTIITTPVEVKPEPKGKVNVKEFYGFWCIHCKVTEPYVDQYLVTNSAIDLERIPLVMGNNKDVNGFGKLGAALSNPDLQQLNVNKLYNDVFNATVTDKVSTALADSANIPAFLKQNGYTPQQIAKFMSTYNSFAVNAKVAKYKAQALMYNIQATPTFIVADKYLVSPAEPDHAMQVILYLVNKINQDGDVQASTSSSRATSVMGTKSASAAQ